MGFISKQYIKRFVCRYDKEVGIPYYSYTDFANLKQEALSFTNSKGIKISYFYYYYPHYNKDKIILFLPGIGPGHTAYLKEIEEICKRGFKVLSLDYTGTDKSEGKYLASLNTPTEDVNELLDYLTLDKEVIVIGHSLGGYTSLNLLNLRNDINKGVIMAGFLSVKSLINSLVKSKFINKQILKYERKKYPHYYDLDNVSFLKETKKKILFIHSIDDQMVPYKSSLAVVEKLNNENLITVSVDHRGHNPNYTEKASKYLQEVFGKYNELIKEKKIKTDKDKINYFKDVSLADLVEQDQRIIEEIINFIK